MDPSSQRAQYRLSRFTYDNDSERGIDSLRAHGLLLDVPLLPQTPTLDGRLDDDIWSRAARVDGAYQFSFSHTAATPSDHVSHFFIGRTARSLWIGFYGEDSEPQDLVAKVTPDMQEIAENYEGGLSVTRGSGLTTSSNCSSIRILITALVPTSASTVSASGSTSGLRALDRKHSRGAISTPISVTDPGGRTIHSLSTSVQITGPSNTESTSTIPTFQHLHQAPFGASI